MITKFGYTTFERGMRFILKGKEYEVEYFGYIEYDTPFDLFRGAHGVITTTGEVFHTPLFFNAEIAIL